MEVPLIWTAVLRCIRRIVSAVALYKLGNSLVHSKRRLTMCLMGSCINSQVFPGCGSKKLIVCCTGSDQDCAAQVTEWSLASITMRLQSL